MADVLRSLGAALPHDHEVNFYDVDADLVSGVARYLKDGLREGESVVVVATAGHCAAVEELLVDQGVDIRHARAAGHYRELDAAATLAAFMVHGAPDPDRFAATIGGTIDAAGRDGSAVRAFGEMVALLWEQGNVTGAIAVESLWNDLAQSRRFSLLCAYPTTALGTSRLTDVHLVCGAHSELRPPLSYGTLTPFAGNLAADEKQNTEVFVPVVTAVPAVRRFVTSTLHAWGEDRLVHDAALVATEMAVNAVVHARSPFRAFVHRAPGVVLIAVKDACEGTVQPALGALDDVDGRGVAIVEALAQRWGCDALPDGKIVWAEFASGKAC